jgi:hypothetical protein
LFGDGEGFCHALFGWNDSVETKDKLNIQVMKGNDGVIFKDVISYPSKYRKVTGKILYMASLFCITNSRMPMIFCICSLLFVRSSWLS